MATDGRLTTAANEVMRPLHERMPVIVGADTDALWLDPSASADALRALFVPYASEGMEAIPVGSWVSNTLTCTVPSALNSVHTDSAPES